MRGQTSPLWPIHYKPLPDELLSSWLVRLAHGHGLKVQTFCNLIFGNRHQVWNRDIDRLAPSWLIDALILHTGTSREAAYATTLHAYAGVLYERPKLAGVSPWIQTLKMYHRKRIGFGLQFCPRCLAEGPQPYFCKRWRVSFCTMCARHRCMLHDSCPQCGQGIAFHRLDTGRGNLSDRSSLGVCHFCGFKLTRGAWHAIRGFDDESNRFHFQLCQALEDGAPASELDMDQLLVMHHLVALLLTNRKAVKLRQQVCQCLGMQDVLPALAGRVAMESLRLADRHVAVQMAAWLMADLEVRLREAWRAKALRYNHMLKDFDHAPSWYVNVVDRFSDWRADAIQLPNTQKSLKLS